MPSVELLNRATQSGEGGGEGKKESLGDYALKNKLKCHPHIKKHWLAVTINFLTETRPTVSKCFNLPIATICKGAGSNGFAIKTKTGKEIAKLAKELICKPWSQDYKVFMHMLITGVHRWEWLVGENTGFAWSKSLDPHSQPSRHPAYFPQLPQAGEFGGIATVPAWKQGEGQGTGGLGPPSAIPHRSRGRTAIASQAGQGQWSRGAMSSTGIWTHRCKMKITLNKPAPSYSPYLLSSCYLLALKIVIPAGPWRSAGCTAHGPALQPPRTDAHLLPQAWNLYKLPAKDSMGREKDLKVTKDPCK